MAKYLNRPVLFAIEFSKPTDDRGRFSNMYDLQAWCKQHGYSVGNTCAMKPTAVMIGNLPWIAKWKNLSKAEQQAVDGVMVHAYTPDGYILYLFNISDVLRDTFPTNLQHAIDYVRILGKDGKLEPLTMTPDKVEWMRLLEIAKVKGVEISYLGNRRRNPPTKMALLMQQQLYNLPDFVKK